MRNLIGNIALVGASVLVSVLLVDGLLWLVSPLNYHTTPAWQPDGHIRGRFAPEQTFQTGPSHNPLFPIREESYQNRINRFGFRGPDFSLEPDDAVVRIAVFGGSAAFNFHDPDEKTWPQRLGDCLTRELGVKTEVLNFALPGFHLGISKINYLINGRVFRPDIAIAYHTWNDLKVVGKVSANVEQLLISPVAQPEVMRKS